MAVPNCHKWSMDDKDFYTNVVYENFAKFVLGRIFKERRILWEISGLDIGFYVENETLKFTGSFSLMVQPYIYQYAEQKPTLPETQESVRGAQAPA